MMRVGMVGLGHNGIAHLEAHRRVGKSEVEDWVDAISQDRSPRCDFFDGANSTVATLMAVEAIRAGRPLAVPAYRRA